MRCASAGGDPQAVDTTLEQIFRKSKIANPDRKKFDKSQIAKANGLMTKLDLERLGNRQNHVQTIHIENQVKERVSTYNNDSSISVGNKLFSPHHLNVHMQSSGVKFSKMRSPPGFSGFAVTPFGEANQDLTNDYHQDLNIHQLTKGITP